MGRPSIERRWPDQGLARRRESTKRAIRGPQGQRASRVRCAPDAGRGRVAHTLFPARGRARFGEVPKRPNGADCKSAGSRLRRFESSPLHQRAVPDPQAGGRAEVGARRSGRRGGRRRDEEGVGDVERGAMASRGHTRSQLPAAGTGSLLHRRDAFPSMGSSRDGRSRTRKRVFRAGIAQLARARAFQARGRGFESRFPLQAVHGSSVERESFESIDPS